MTRAHLSARAGFQLQTIEKVERVLEFLSEVGRHPFLGSRVVLYGGTALNVFHLDLPRLSVDADLTYVGSVGVEEMRAERPAVETAIRQLGDSLGYRVTTSSQESHAGRTFYFRYQYHGQGDHFKVDLTFMNRVPLLPYSTERCGLSVPPCSVPTLALAELVAGKCRALMERKAVRDLYDLHLVEQLDLSSPRDDVNPETYRLQRRVRLFYVSMSEAFPCEIDGRWARRFEDAHTQVDTDLYPVLASNDRPSLSDMVRSVDQFLLQHVAPKDREEHEYLQLLDRECTCEPRLLFEPWPDVLDRAQRSPDAAWKVKNLKRRSH